MYKVSFGYDSINIDDILDIYKYLRKKQDIKYFRFIKTIFIELLSCGRLLAKIFVSLNNRPCNLKQTLVDVKSS